MIEIIENCFKDQVEQGNWQSKIKAMVPSYQESLVDDADLLRKVRKRVLSVLELA